MRIHRQVFKFLDYPHPSECNPITFNNTEDYLFRPHIHSIKKHIYAETVSLCVFLLFVIAILFLAVKVLLGISILLTISAAVALFYLGLMVFKLIVVFQSLSRPLISFDEDEINSIKDFYT